MTDQESEDEKILAVGLNNPIYKNLNDYSELYPHLLLEIEHFFSIYKELEAKRTRIKGWEDAAAACRIVTESQERYLKNM
jgi:inorganic pyrophosphatase